MRTITTGVDVTATTRHDRAPQRVATDVVLRSALPVTVAAGVLTSVVVTVLHGWSAGLAGLVGTAVAAVFFASGLLVLGKVVTDARNPVLFMAVGLATYGGQVLLLLLVLVVARQVEGFDSVSAGVAVLVCVVVWQVAQVRAWRRARVPVYDDVTLPAGAPATPPAGPVDRTGEAR
ncbi:hypothetical protein GCM10009814_23540 [Lapillicoccus jejuensis]